MASNVTAPTREYPVIDTVEALQQHMKEMRKAQQEFATYTQEQVDKIFFAAAMAANKARIPLAKMAVEETGMGVVEDKVIKNHYASEYIYNAYQPHQDLRRHRGGQRLRHQKDCRADRPDCGGHPDHQPDLHGNL